MKSIIKKIDDEVRAVNLSWPMSASEIDKRIWAACPVRESEIPVEVRTSAQRRAMRRILRRLGAKRGLVSAPQIIQAASGRCCLCNF